MALHGSVDVLGSRRITASDGFARAFKRVTGVSPGSMRRPAAAET
ncbi:hypothetical protein [Rhodococcus sp. HM1]|nr:hypothetical protein [Rhodococcus sp. HM1]